MRLTCSFKRPRLAALLCVTLLSLPASLALWGSARADAPAPQPAATNPDDVLGNLVVPPGASRALPRIAVIPSLSADIADVTLRSVVQRDLDLCGEFEVLPDRDAPPEASLTDSGVDIDAWKKKGVEALVKVTASTAGDQASLNAQALLVSKGSSPIFTKTVSVPAKDVREQSHRLADLLIGALTGQNGGFASRMTFVSGAGTIRRAYVMDADGQGARAVSPVDELAIGAAFGKGEELHWIASADNEQYRIENRCGPVSLPVKGSVYGLAFSKGRDTAAASIATGSGIKAFLGPDLDHLQPASEVRTALDPTFTPGGKLAFAGAGRYGQRIFVDGKAVTPDGVSASHPTFCNHPDGVKLIFAASVGARSDLVLTGESGGGLVRLTQNQGSNYSPACSPDGRLVAFFSTRTSGEGPGLYLMRIDGLRPKRVSTLTGQALRWEPLRL